LLKEKTKNPNQFIAFVVASALFYANTFAEGEEIKSNADVDNDTGVEIERNQVVLNWSSTHSCHPEIIYYPKSSQEVSRVLSKCNKSGSNVRPVGTALSPNGIGLSTTSKDNTKCNNLISLSALDYVEGLHQQL